MADQSPRAVGFIPARAESTRFPGKPLAEIAGKPMIMWVFERALESGVLKDVVVATDSDHILEAVEANGGKAVMTSREHPSGTDRVAEAAEKMGLGKSDIAVNIQGDQPLFASSMISEVVAPLVEDTAIPMSTLMYRIVRDEEITHPNAVKTVVDSEGFAIYFSRSTIPFVRPGEPLPVYYKHHGIYAYRNDFLQKFRRLPQRVLERTEHLEQLRAIEHGYRIKVVITQQDSIEVDTPEDLQRVEDCVSEVELTKNTHR
jgi:3-deoxy-manno-octulosonate cytidylyltransferase (CMP-KDO synthetase)